MTEADYIYTSLLSHVLEEGDEVTTRNSDVYTHFNLPNITFETFPLITLRRTAWKKAIKEMEWFLSGRERCPEDLLDWWSGQLDLIDFLQDGYSRQFRHSTMSDHKGNYATFDQVKFILDGLKNSPNSRRLLISMWNAGEMANITKTNDNANTPTCCHSIVIQFFVRNGKLHMKTYQRSADMLLGVPHNWVQSWAMLMYFAYHSGLAVGTMTWMWGDAHIYKEESHIETAKSMIEFESHNLDSLDLEYNFSGDYDSVGVPVFKASDFILKGAVPEPIIKTRPKLL